MSERKKSKKQPLKDLFRNLKKPFVGVRRTLREKLRETIEQSRTYKQKIREMENIEEQKKILEGSTKDYEEITKKGRRRIEELEDEIARLRENYRKLESIAEERNKVIKDLGDIISKQNETIEAIYFSKKGSSVLSETIKHIKKFKDRVFGSDSAYFELDSNGVIIDFNGNIVENIGYLPKLKKGKSEIISLLHQEDSNLFEEILSRIKKDISIVGFEFGAGFRNLSISHQEEFLHYRASFKIERDFLSLGKPALLRGHLMPEEYDFGGDPRAISLYISELCSKNDLIKRINQTAQFIEEKTKERIPIFISFKNVWNMDDSLFQFALGMNKNELVSFTGVYSLPSCYYTILRNNFKRERLHLREPQYLYGRNMREEIKSELESLQKNIQDLKSRMICEP